MKLYLLNGTYYEKQADVPKGQGAFEVVEFPFSASPKADFVEWINVRGVPQADDLEEIVTRAEQEWPVAKPQPAPQQPAPEAPGWKADSVMVWLLDEATPAQVEQLFARIGTRFHEANGGRA